MRLAVHTYYRQQVGAGPAIVLIHGVGLDQGMWDEVAAPLVAAGHAVVRYDLLGHGRTPALGRDIEVSDLTAQLEELLRDLEIDAAAVVGFSLGALVARAYAMHYPARLTHLVLLNSVFARSKRQRDAVERRYRDACEQGLSTLIDAALERWFSDDFAQRRPEVLAQVRERLNSNQPQGFLPAYRLFAQAGEESAEQLRAIDVPTWVITGSQDGGSTPAMSVRLAESIPHARLQVLDGVRHMLPLERAQWLSEALQEFVATSTGRRGGSCDRSV